MRIASLRLLFSMFVLGGLTTTTNAAELSPEGELFTRVESDENLNVSQALQQQNAKSHDLKQGWHHNYDTAIAEAKKSGKPVVLHFYADWCGPCRAMEQNVLNTNTVTSLLGDKIIGAKINVDQYGELKGQFGVSTFPSDVFIKADGTVITKSSGKMDANTYASVISSIAAKASPAKRKNPIVVVSREVRQQDKTIGLKGFSPVELSLHEKWKKGSDKFAWNYAGVVYHMSNQAEFEQFKSNPARYAPKLHGNDPVLMSNDKNQMVRGNIQHTIFFNDGVYLFKSKQNLNQFMETPWKYSVQNQVVEQSEPVLR